MLNSSLPGSVLFLVFLLLSSASAADLTLSGLRSQEIEQWLQDFERDSVTQMNAPLPKRDSHGKLIAPRSAFSLEAIQNGDFVLQRDLFRKKLYRKKTAGRSGIQGNDLVEELVDQRNPLRDLEVMDQKGLRSSKLPEAPWSDYYWPIYNGITAARYADSRFPDDLDWKKSHDYAVKNSNTLEAIFKTQNSSSIDLLSPAEKYDLLIGDLKGTLTRRMWDEGHAYYREHGEVESWMGICHGWAPASYQLPRPRKMVTVTAADGKTRLNFYPSDIKALASLIWANAPPAEEKFIGGRCNTKTPTLDSSGRVNSQDCFDTNPGTWHMAVVNQIGIARRSFVIDATYDYEVWNHPVYSYSYTYFNPVTKKETRDLSKAVVAISAYKEDKFSRHRSKAATSVVGIAMDVSYVVETVPSHRKTDSTSNDMRNSVRYLYDLELNARGEIIGGEWYTNLHPDFLWTFLPQARAVTPVDRYARGDWQLRESPVPEAWRQPAIRAAAEGMPLAKIVEALIVESHLK
jgi:hypothetical protein